MKILLAVLFLASVIGHAGMGRNVGPSSPPPACGADTARANAYAANLTEYLSTVDRSSFGLPFPPPQGSIVRITSKPTCTAAITAYNSAFPAGHASRIANGVYLFKIGTTRYAVYNENLLHVFDTSWVLLFAVSTID